MTESETICVMEPDKREHRQGGARRSGTSTSSRSARNSKPGKKPRRSWKQLSGGEKALRVLIIIATVLAVLFVAVAVATRLIFVKPTSPDTPSIPLSSTDPELNIPGPKVSGDRKENFFTFLVIGRDTGGGGNTDTLMLAAYDVNNQELNVMSIPRDTMVNVSWDIKKINSVYNFNGGGDKGIEALCAELSQLVGFVPDYQIVVEWDAVGELVDAIGGVYFDVPIDMNYDDPAQDLHIHLSKGYQHLDGEAAMGVVRYRHDNMVNGKMKGYPNGDLGRIETQQAFLTAVIEQCLQFKNITKIGELAKIFEKNVTTNLSVNNLLWFGQQAILGNEKSGKTLDMDDVNFVTMPNEGVYAYSRTYGNMQSYVVPIADELVDLVNESFNPYLEDLTDQELDIMGVNKNGSIYSSTGYVEDKQAAGYSGGSSSGGSSSSGNSSGGNSNSSGGSSNSRPSSTPKPSEEPVTTPTVSEKPTQEPQESVNPVETPSGGSEVTEPTATPESTPHVPVETPSPVPTTAPTPAPTPAPVPTSAPTPASGGDGAILPPEAE